MEKKIAAGELTATAFIEQLQQFRSDEEQQKIRRYFKTDTGDYGHGDQFMGVRMGDVFALAKAYGNMPVVEIEQLLESPLHEVRAGAVSIMDKASRGKIAPQRLRDFFELYMRRHDRINNWDLVDLGCLYMTGSYLFDRPRDVLYKLAQSPNRWERRTAILSTCYFLRKGDLDDTFQLAGLLVDDSEDLVHKATGWMLRFAGDKDRPRLLAFLDRHAATMPRTLLRSAIEKLDKTQRDHYMRLKDTKT